MDAGPGSRPPGAALVVTAAGECVGLTGEESLAAVTPFLKSPKTRKYMGHQDRMAVIAAGRALEGIALDDDARRDRIGIFAAIGYIPFERAEIELLAENSLGDGGGFSMERFSTVGIHQVNPLLAFRCLPNMPVFHVSLNFGLQGPYFVTYPGAGQFYVALEEAVAALEAGEIDRALVGGVADQRNFLVTFQHDREPPYAGAQPTDAAAFVMIERVDGDRAVAGLRLAALDVAYDAAAVDAPHRESMKGAAGDATNPGPYLGPASLPAFVARELRASRGAAVHELVTADGIRAASTWERA